MEDFTKMLNPVTITKENLFDYFEITDDEEYYYISPKEGILSIISTVPSGSSGLYLSFTFDCTYDVAFYDGETYVFTAEITQDEEGTSLYRSGDSVTFSKKVSTPTTGQIIDGKYYNYTMTVKEFSNFTVTEVSQTPYSVCKPEINAEYYNRVGDENVILYSKDIRESFISCHGFTESGKNVERAYAVSENGKSFLYTSFEGDPEIGYDSFVSENDFDIYGNFAWFRNTAEDYYYLTEE